MSNSIAHAQYAPMIQGLNGVASAAATGAAAPPDATYITAESLFVYCQSRLGELDSQMKAMFANQEKANKDNETINGLISSLNNCQANGFDMSTKAGCDLVGAVQYAINQVGANTPTGQKLIALRDKMTDRMCPDGKLTQAARDNTLWTAPGNTDADVIANFQGKPGAGITATEVQTWVSDAKSIGSDISAGAELNMIELQSVMSKRQTAIQLTTNLIQSLGDQANKIAANVGH